MSPRSAFETALRGYRAAPTPERATFEVSSAFAATIAISRALNYVRERRRAAPRVRSWLRRAYHAPGRQKSRFHHFAPGIAILLVTGFGAVVTREDGREWRFSVPFGVGAGLTTDEVALLIELDNPYWKSERFSLGQAAVGALVATALAVRFGIHFATRPAEEGELGPRSGVHRPEGEPITESTASTPPSLGSS
jgi:ABC-type Fe3+ transport system permease subunit